MFRRFTLAGAAFMALTAYAFLTAAVTTAHPQTAQTLSEDWVIKAKVSAHQHFNVYFPDNKPLLFATLPACELFLASDSKLREDFKDYLDYETKEHGPGTTIDMFCGKHEGPGQDV